jgi:hypothetical protein
VESCWSGSFVCPARPRAASVGERAQAQRAAQQMALRFLSNRDENAELSGRTELPGLGVGGPSRLKDAALLVYQQVRARARCFHGGADRRPASLALYHCRLQCHDSVHAMTSELLVTPGALVLLAVVPCHMAVVTSIRRPLYFLCE